MSDTDPNTTVIAAFYQDPVAVIARGPARAVVIGQSAGAIRASVPTAQGPIGPAGPKGDKGDPGQVPYFVAGADLGGHRALMFQTDGSVVNADPNSDGYVFAGISLGAAAAGCQIQVASTGTVIEPSWSWVPLSPVYVAAPGVLTQSPPGMGLFHLVAFAVTATMVSLSPTLPTLLA